ncbi:triacylglycerol lipase [Poronia punctata]|nr:triacylglycerol lipase [Poronia punctata]
MATEGPKPRILLISMNGRKAYINRYYSDLLDQLRAKARLLYAYGANMALARLSAGPPPDAVLITDADVTYPDNADVWEVVLRYVRRGGTAILTAQFSSLARSRRTKTLFEKAGLPWEVSGSYYCRMTFQLNPRAAGDEIAARLPHQYCVQGLSLSNVAPEDAWYVADGNSGARAAVLGPNSVVVQGDAVVTMANIGVGKLGYTGDVNREETTNLVILAMCGL